MLLPYLPSPIYPEARPYSRQAECRCRQFSRSPLLLSRMGTGSFPWIKTYLPTMERVIARPRYRPHGLNSSPRERNIIRPRPERCSLCSLFFGDYYNCNDCHGCGPFPSACCPPTAPNARYITRLSSLHRDPIRVPPPSITHTWRQRDRL